MVEYKFEIIEAKPLKGHRIERTTDYGTRVCISKDGKVVFDDVLMVRKNALGVFPDEADIKKKIKTPAMRKELVERLKEYYKKVR